MTASKPRDAQVVEAADLPSVAERETGVLGAAYRALSVGIVSVVLLIAFEATAVGTAMPVAARELDGVSLYAFAFSGYFTTSLFGMVLSGQWSDGRGPLGPLTTGIASLGAGLLLSGTDGVSEEAGRAGSTGSGRFRTRRAGRRGNRACGGERSNRPSRAASATR